MQLIQIKIDSSGIKVNMMINWGMKNKYLLPVTLGINTVENWGKTKILLEVILRDNVTYSSGMNNIMW